MMYWIFAFCLCVSSCVQRRTDTSKDVSHEVLTQQNGLNLTGTMKEECQKFLAKSPKASNASEQAYIDYAKTCTQMDEKELEKIMQDPAFQSSYADLKTQIQQNSNSTQAEKKNNGLQISFFVEGGVFALLAFGLGAVSYNDWARGRYLNTFYKDLLSKDEYSQNIQLIKDNEAELKKFDEDFPRKQQELSERGSQIEQRLKEKVSFLGYEVSYSEVIVLESLLSITPDDFAKLNREIAYDIDSIKNEDLKNLFRNTKQDFQAFDDARRRMLIEHYNYKESEALTLDEANKLKEEQRKYVDEISLLEEQRMSIKNRITTAKERNILLEPKYLKKEINKAKTKMDAGKSNAKISAAIAILSAGLFAAGGALSLQGESENTSPLAIFLTNLGRLSENK